MADIVRTSDFYSFEAVRERISARLGTGEWPNIKNTDLGQRLINHGANIVFQESVAFFTALEQFFLETCTETGYAEAIAKNFGVVPQTFKSSQITVTMQFASDRSFDAHDLVIVFDETRFYNIKSESFIGGEDKTITLYEGRIVRQASQVYSPPGKQWTYSQLPAPILRTIGEQNVQRYLVIPSNAFIPSVVVSVAGNETSQPITWTLVDSWFGYSEYDRIFLIEKDYVGRYRIVFGDGEFGASYPLSEIVNLRYLVSSGSNVSIANFSQYAIYEQDYYDITSQVTIPAGGISALSLGRNDIDLDDLKQSVYAKQTAYQRLVRVEDYVNYLNSRDDVLDSVVISERDSNPPNIEMFNVLLFSVKPMGPTSPVNLGDIQNYVSRYGIQTVEFRHTPMEQVKFNVRVELSPMSGYTASSLITSAQSILDDTYAWLNLGFKATITANKVMSDIIGIEGIDFTRFTAEVEAVHTDTTDGVCSFDFADNEVISLLYPPVRYGVSLYSPAFSGVPNLRVKDDGNGVILGFFAGTERFASFSPPGRSTVTSTGVIFHTEGGVDSVRVINANTLSGAVSSVDITENATSLDYDKANNVLYALDVVTPASSVALRSYKLNANQLDPTHPSFVQKQENLSLSVTSSLAIPAGVLSGASGLPVIRYFEGYVYILVNRTAAAARLFRVAVSSDGTIATDYDTVYAYKTLNSYTYTDMVPVKGQYGTSENVMWFVNPTQVELIDSFDLVSSNTLRNFSTLSSYVAIAADVNKDLYISRTNGDLVKLYGMYKGGTPSTKTLGTAATSVGDILVFGSPSQSYKLYIFDRTTKLLNYIYTNVDGQTAVYRAGFSGSSTAVDSIKRAATVDYLAATVTFTEAITDGELGYQVQGGVALTGVRVAVANRITVSEKS